MSELSDADRKQLLDVARGAIAHGLKHHTAWCPEPRQYGATLQEQRAVFVTLRDAEGKLRGCIGNLVARDAVVLETARAAHNAALKDPRFAPVTATELPALRVHISVLSVPAPMRFESETDLLSQLRPGVDGVILREGERTSTFLPSVWESLAEPRAFMEALKAKAGLPHDHWSDTLQAERYGTESFGEKG